MPIGSKEFDLLCACARVEIAPQVAARIANADAGSLDWNEFLRLAEHHGVLPLVARSLQEQGSELPSEVRKSLQLAEKENIRRSLWFAVELARILEHFDKSSLRAVPYKGPALAESVYGDVTLRNFSDLDLLISPADYAKALQALAELGYCPSEGWRPPIERFWRKYGYERAFDGEAGKYLVELQWALSPHFNAIDLRIGDFLARSCQTQLNGRSISCLSSEDSLVALCLHAAKHLWMRLLWVCDIAESMRTQTIDYSAVVARARQMGILRMLGVSFWLAENLLEAELCAIARDVVANDREVPILGKSFAERPADRVRYLWRLVWTPGVGELSAVQLPEPLFPLYRFVRLARLLRKLLRPALIPR
jgi:hypothetical protein